MWCHCCWCLCHMIPTVSSMAPSHLLCQDDQKEITCLFWSCNAIGTSNSIMWCQRLHQWHQYFCLVKIIKMRCNISFWSCDVIGIDFGIKWCHLFQKWHHGVQHNFGACHATGISITQYPGNGVMGCHWYWCQHHGMQTSLLKQSHSLSHVDQD